ncbi:MAG: hypothetical protein ABGY41_08350 [Candidatus Poribacteria bacterium]
MGASDKTGAFPAQDPLIPGDIVSTIYRCLGIRHERHINDQLHVAYAEHRFSSEDIGLVFRLFEEHSSRD